MTVYHPLDPLTLEEIAAASSAFRTELLRKDLKSVKNTYISLLEPPKSEVIAYLGIATSPTDTSPAKSDIFPARRAESAVVDNLTGDVYYLTCTIGTTTTVDSCEKLPDGVQPGVTPEEMLLGEEIVRSDPRVIKLCADVGVTQEQIMCDCWSIGFDDRFGPKTRLMQALIYARRYENDHLYAHPLDFLCVVDGNAGKVLKIDFPTHRGADGKHQGETKPTAVDADSLEASGRARIPPPLESQDYLPELLAEQAAARGEKWAPRTDIKPLHVVQPEGVSFTVDGNRVRWQNWDFHVGFNYREGIVLNTVQYFDRDEGRLRPVLYRASLSEMLVPYASPEWPHPRKFAFDVGEYGLGLMANSLSLGCDCLGAIHYLDGTLTDLSGAPFTLKNAVCIHEEDDGLLWKHTDFRPGGRAASVRSRKLIVQMICTVANYDYAFAWTFRQDGTIAVEIKLTGILNTYTLAQGEECAAFATQVAPRVQAQHHQHVFCMRFDPMVDGLRNSVTETEVKAVPEPTGSAENYAGNGFFAETTILEAAGGRAADAGSCRAWTIVNEDKTHYSSGQPEGFRFMCSNYVPMFSKPDSFIARRAPFARSAFWVTPYSPDELYAAGKYVQQSSEAHDDALGVRKHTGSVRNADIVTWINVGLTHVTRPEDFPVMPYDHVAFALKPIGFFKRNPALDVPEGKDAKSVPAQGEAKCKC